ncbi:ATP-binding cassette domain-containing protein [Salibaculum sp.]|uniref:thiamine ABC transporter ATP-binding protein n=1 Tax=Salibaculum sp. TaxID=2855480 RepID=UPI002B46C03B|nr:ATP-binding cassette domain-containing protein [Salibaculum sp.]HKL69453.1 ATP-binding cassette domain-containing protein [Salibaculum sp.]
MALELEHVNIALDGFELCADLKVGTGGFIALLGPSGAGKSTVLNAVAGFVPLASGAIRWGDARIDHLPPGDRPVATLFQDNNLFPHLNVARNVALALTTRARPSKDDTRRAEEALSRVGLSGMGARMPGTLSGGQQSRAALARVLLQNKPLVMLDEPFSALGPGQRQEMLALCREVLGGAGRTVLFVSHDPVDAAQADAICVVIDGTMSPPRPVTDVLDAPSGPLRAYLGK